MNEQDYENRIGRVRVSFEVFDNQIDLVNMVLAHVCGRVLAVRTDYYNKFNEYTIMSPKFGIVAEGDETPEYLFTFESVGDPPNTKIVGMCRMVLDNSLSSVIDRALNSWENKEYK